MADLLINDTDVLQYGVRMGTDFLKALLQPPDFKDYVTNVSRLEDGTRYVITDGRVKEREVTLPFVLIAKSMSEAIVNHEKFLDLLVGEITLQVPKIGNEKYKLIVQSFSSFSRNYRGNILSVKVKFKEANPANRA